MVLLAEQNEYVSGQEDRVRLWHEDLLGVAVNGDDTRPGQRTQIQRLNRAIKGRRMERDDKILGLHREIVTITQELRDRVTAR